MATVVIRRPTRGSRISSFYPVRELPALSSLDSAFQLQEYISLLIRRNVHDVDAIVSIPDKGASEDKDKEKAEEKEGDAEKKDSGVDEACWIYEQLRRLAQDLSHPLITMLQQECNRASCPEMKAGEWLYLCVAHGNDGAMEQCCAIDYILHTLDSATALLNSPRAFPSRLSIPPTSNRHFSSLARRLGRIFAHAYFHHREAFEQAEAESALYERFLALTSKFDLVPAEFLVIPPRVTGRENEDIPPEPRLRGAAVDAGAAVEEDIEEEDERLWDRSLPTNNQTRGPPGLGLESPSSRKSGRTRTDTMVHSEAFSVAEELARAEAISAAEHSEESQDAAQEAPEDDDDDVPFITVEGDPEPVLPTDEESLRQDLPVPAVEEESRTEESIAPEDSQPLVPHEEPADTQVAVPQPEQESDPSPNGGEVTHLEKEEPTPVEPLTKEPEDKPAEDLQSTEIEAVAVPATEAKDVPKDEDKETGVVSEGLVTEKVEAEEKDTDKDEGKKSDSSTEPEPTVENKS